MAFDFSISPRVEKQRQQIADFVAAEVIPVEQQVFREGLTDTLRRGSPDPGQGSWCLRPQAPEALGGGGFRFDESAVLLEEAGYSLLGPLALNCAAPDEGNIHLLHLTGTDEQKERYLAPLVAGTVRSCFSMTEPPPAPAPTRAPCGPAPARRRWLGRQRREVAHHRGRRRRLLHRHGPQRGRGSAPGATMFLVPADNPGFVLGDHLNTIDGTFLGGHCASPCATASCPMRTCSGARQRVSAAQVRLAPARLTHCMRWLGAARRAHDIAVERCVGRGCSAPP